jgi:hypothetical protein
VSIVYPTERIPDMRHPVPMRQRRRRPYSTLKCFSIKRQDARREWLNDIASYLSQNHTQVGMKHIILQNLNQFLEPSQITDHEIDFDISAFDKANQQQNIIGWQHFIRGRLSFEWGKAISVHLSTDQFHHMSAKKWAADLLYINWQYILQIWRERCTEIHGINPAEIEQKTKIRCLEEIHYIQ